MSTAEKCHDVPTNVLIANTKKRLTKTGTTTAGTSQHLHQEDSEVVSAEEDSEVEATSEEATSGEEDPREDSKNDTTPIINDYVSYYNKENE